jgi:hypothetical protein
MVDKTQGGVQLAIAAPRVSLGASDNTCNDRVAVYINQDADEMRIFFNRIAEESALE